MNMSYQTKIDFEQKSPQSWESDNSPIFADFPFLVKANQSLEALLGVCGYSNSSKTNHVKANRQHKPLRGSYSSQLKALLSMGFMSRIGYGIKQNTMTTNSTVSAEISSIAVRMAQRLMAENLKISHLLLYYYFIYQVSPVQN